MLVVLKRNWFCPGGYRIKRGDPPKAPVEVPEQFRDRLPSDAVIVEDGSYVPEPEPQEATTLSEAAEQSGIDFTKAASDEMQAIQNADVEQDAANKLAKEEKAQAEEDRAVEEDRAARAAEFQASLEAEAAKNSDEGEEPSESEEEDDDNEDS